MDISRAEKVRLGVFIALSSFIVAGVLAWLVGRQMWEEKISYHTVFDESVDGLNPGAPVKLNGVSVGQVTKLNVNPENINEVIVHFSVERGTPIKPGMKSNMVGGLSITGLKSIELTGGDATAENLEGGTLIPAGTSQMRQLTGQAENIALKFEAVLNNIYSLTSADNQAAIQDILTNSRKMTIKMDSVLTLSSSVIAALPSDIKRLTKEVEATTKVIKAASEDIRKEKLGKKAGVAITDLQKTIKSLKVKVETMPLRETTEAIMQASKSIESTSKRADITIYKIQDNLNSSIRNLKETMDNMNDFSRQIKENPSILLRSEEKKGRER